MLKLNMVEQICKQHFAMAHRQDLGLIFIAPQETLIKVVRQDNSTIIGIIQKIGSLDPIKEVEPAKGYLNMVRNSENL